MTISETSNGQCRLSADYRLDLFKPERISQLLDHFELIIKTVLDNDQLNISRLSLLSEEEKKTLQSFNQTETHYPSEKNLVQFFEEQVQKFGEKIALRYAGKGLSYQALNEKSNQLAHYVKTLGIKKGELVGIGMMLIMVAAGANHSLALTSKHDLYSCGYNAKGQLGLG